MIRFFSNSSEPGNSRPPWLASPRVPGHRPTAAPPRSASPGRLSFVNARLGKVRRSVYQRGLHGGIHPLRELRGVRRRAWLFGISLPWRRGRREQRRLRERSGRELATAAACALTAGAALEFFLDPCTGKRRRHLVRARTTAAVRRGARRVERRAHYQTGKIVGLAHAITHHEHARPELDDVGLVRKVESELFRDRTIPKGLISINADRGIVVLRGQLEEGEQIKRIEHEVRGIAGVRDVENLLHPPGAAMPTRRPRGDPRTIDGHA